MSKAFLGGFVAIAVLAAGGVDYLNQARRAGLAPGSLTVAGYGATITDRIGGREPARAAPAPAAAAVETAREAPKSSGGILAMITGLFGGGTSQGDHAAPAPAAVTRIGANGDCASAGLAKRCSVGGD